MWIKILLLFATVVSFHCSYSLSNHTYDDQVRDSEIKDTTFSNVYATKAEKSRTDINRVPVRDSSSKAISNASILLNVVTVNLSVPTTEKLVTTASREVTYYQISDNSTNGTHVHIQEDRVINGSVFESLRNVTETETTTESEFLRCAKIRIQFGDYDKLKNGSVYVHLYKRLFNSHNYRIDKYKRLYICSNFIRDEVSYDDDDDYSEHLEDFDNFLRIFSYSCTYISIIFNILHIFMFIFIKELRNLPGYCLLSLCVAATLAYICSLIQYNITDPVGCTTIGMFMFYFFLASFYWMNVMAFDIWHSIRYAAIKLRPSVARPIIRQFLIYSVYGWGTPMVIVITSIIVHYSTENDRYRLIFDRGICWFEYREALTLYFAGPVFALMGINFLFFVSVFYMISRHTMRKTNSESQGMVDLKSRLIICLKLSCVMGLMWIFGIIAEFTRQVWLQYLYVLCSALQGAFIFFSFAISRRTRKCFMKSIQRKKPLVPSPGTSDGQTEMASI